MRAVRGGYPDRRPVVPGQPGPGVGLARPAVEGDRLLQRGREVGAPAVAVGGRFDSARAMTSFTVGDSSGRSRVTSGTASCRCANIVATVSERGNGSSPVSRTYATHASAYWSVRPSTCPPLICSGAE